MKKITLIASLFIGFFGYSQSNTERIQKYLDSNVSKFGLSTKESKDWFVEAISTSETTGIENCVVKQTFNGIEIYESFYYFWIKNGEIINNPEVFKTNFSSKANAVAPTLTVNQAFEGMLTQLNEPTFSTSILESKENYKFKLSNGALNEDPINARLIYFQINEDSYRLAWSYEFYSQNVDHLWNVQVDAVNGKVLRKKDMVVRCGFSKKNHNEHSHNSNNTHSLENFQKTFFKQEEAAAMLTPGTTNYKVVPYNYESPGHYLADFPANTFGGRIVITNPEKTTSIRSTFGTPSVAVAAASPNGWHNTNNTIGGGTITTQFAYTRGNNVLASSDYFDVDLSNPTTYTSASTGTYPSLTFDYAYGGSGVNPSSYISAATTNLFYMNNIMHDLWYQYGFNEANRNFQTVNYGRGGTASDQVMADAQDGSQKAVTATAGPDLNNANFATPADGTRPRMQMYLWDGAPANSVSFTINSALPNNPAGIVGVKLARDNRFVQAAPYHVYAPAGGLTSDLVLYQDATPDGTDGCETATNAAVLNGKIAVIRRGTCSFIQKVENAQAAGAAAVLIINNVADPVDIYMGGNDEAPSITIPSFSINQADGEAIITALASNTINVTITGPNPAFIANDGDFDNGIVAHEYGHGISTRLVGGGGGLRSAEQPGEGWSDWFALMMLIKPGDTSTNAKGIGTWASSEPTTGNGIREYKYTTDMTVNPHTYGSTNLEFIDTTNPTTGEPVQQILPHGVGSIWCAMLWDLSWSYINKYGYSSDIFAGTAGNNRVMQLIIDALKLTPANPSFVQCKAAIIAADQATTGGQDYCLITQVFARRGLGQGASAGTNGTSGAISEIQDQTESFTLEPAGPNCTAGSFLATTEFENNNFLNIFPNPTNGELFIHTSKEINRADIDIIDMNGRVVYSEKAVNLTTTKVFNLNYLQSGVYVLKIKGEGLNLVKKLVIN